MGRARTAHLLAAGVLLATGCSSGPHSDVTRPRNAEAIAAGQTIWSAQCAACHGSQLEGGQTPEGSSVPALVDAELSHPDSDFVSTVAGGEAQHAGLRERAESRRDPASCRLRTVRPGRQPRRLSDVLSGTERPYVKSPMHNPGQLGDNESLL